MEPLGSVIFYSNTWTLAGTLQIPDWKNLMNRVSEYKEIVGKYCNETGLTQCHAWTHRIESRLRDTEDKIEHISFFYNEARLEKRGWINCVGSFSTFLFGTMDADDELEIKTKLAGLEGQKDESWTFMKKQLIILSDNFNLITEPMANIHEHQQLISKTLDEVVSKMNTIRSESYKNMLLQQTEERVGNIIENIEKMITSLNKYIRIYILH